MVTNFYEIIKRKRRSFKEMLPNKVLWVISAMKLQVISTFIKFQLLTI